MFMKINLSRALKEKNRLIKKIKDIQTFIQINNLFCENENKIDVISQTEELEKNINKLVDLKSAIAKANSEYGISYLVYKMEELKSLVAFYKRFSTKTNGYSYDCEGERVREIAQIDYENSVKTVSYLEQQIEDIQDQIDDLNATTFIEI